MGTQHESHRFYDPGEDDFIRDTMDEPAAIVAEILGRTAGSVVSRRMRLTDPDARDAFRRYQVERNEESLKGADHYGETWTIEEDQFVLDTLDDPLPDVAEVLGRSIKGVAGRRLRLRQNLVDFSAERALRSVSGRSDPVSAGPLCTSCWTYHRGDCL